MGEGQLSALTMIAVLLTTPKSPISLAVNK
jgi:hypothetical protein